MYLSYKQISCHGGCARLLKTKASEFSSQPALMCTEIIGCVWVWFKQRRNEFEFEICSSSRGFKCKSPVRGDIYRRKLHLAPCCRQGFHQTSPPTWPDLGRLTRSSAFYCSSPWTFFSRLRIAKLCVRFDASLKVMAAHSSYCRCRKNKESHQWSPNDQDCQEGQELKQSTSLRLRFPKRKSRRTAHKYT